MTNTSKLATGKTFPKIQVSQLNGTTVELGKAQENADWQMVVVYRGKHCPLCQRYLNLLEDHKKALADIGVSILAVSADSKAQLSAQMETLDISYPIAYGLSETQMKTLGLYISTPRSEEETDHNFSEPALFVINEEGILQAVNISNAPFLRPEPEIIVRGLTFVRNQDNYPIRGTLPY
jgi:peroxiredoxin